MKSLPDYVEFKSFPGTPLKDIFSAAGDDLLDLLARLLDCNPNGRVSSSQVLKYISFSNEARHSDVSWYTNKVILKPPKYFYFKALQMPYFANKPAPTPPNLLPTPKLPGATIIKGHEKAKKRKMANIPEAKSGE